MTITTQRAFHLFKILVRLMLSIFCSILNKKKTLLWLFMEVIINPTELNIYVIYVQSVPFWNIRRAIEQLQSFCTITLAFSYSHYFVSFQWTKNKYNLSIHCNLGHGRKKKGVGGSILGMCLFSVTCERCDIKAGKEKKKAHVANFNDFLYFFFFFWFLFFCRSAWTTATEVHAIYYIHIRHYLLQKGPLTCIREYIPTYTR